MARVWRKFGQGFLLSLALALGACEPRDGIWYRNRPLVVPAHVSKRLEFSPPADWQRVDVDRFAFSIPSTMKDLHVQGIDSFVKAYEDRSLKLVFDFTEGPLFGAFAGAYEYPRNITTTSEWVLIDGRKAEIITQDRVINGKVTKFVVAYIPHVRRIPPAGLTMTAECHDVESKEVAKSIFGTIKFSK